MRLSPLGRSFIQRTERLALVAYPDGNGYSIGYGHFGAQKGDTISKATAEALFDADVKRFEAVVNRVTPDVRLQQQFDALVSFAYNIGEAGYESSTAARLQRAGDEAGAANAMRLWKLSKGAVSPVLVARRERERALYLTGDASGAVPELVMAPAPVAPLRVAAGVAAGAYFALPRLPFARRALALSPALR
jgi:lysozyme